MQYDQVNEEGKKALDDLFYEKFKDSYNVVVIYGENQTGLTSFEIIKYE